MQKLVYCPNCGGTGEPRWMGPLPRPINTANAGILVNSCGSGWYHGGDCSRKASGCGKREVFCYSESCGNRIGWQTIIETPQSWFVHGSL